MSNAIYPNNVKGLTFSILKTMEWKTLVQPSPSLFTLRIPQALNPNWHLELVYDYLYDTFLSPQNIQPYAPYSDLQMLMGFVGARQGGADDFLFLDTSDYCAAGLRSGTWQPNWPFPLGTVVIDRFGHAQLVTTAGTSGPFAPTFSQSGGTTADGTGTLVWTDKGFFPDGWPDAPVTLPLLTDTLGAFYSPLQRNFAGMFQEDITDLQPAGGADGTNLLVYSNGSLQSQGTNYTIEGPGLALPGAAFEGLYLKWVTTPTAPITATFRFYFRMKFEEDTQDFERWMKGLWTIGGNNARSGAGYVKLVTSRNPSI